MSIIVYFGIIALCLALWFASAKWRQRQRKARRDELYGRAFPAEWVTLLKQNVGLYSALPAALQNTLHGHIHYFLADKRFVGCDGLDVTEDMRLTIAANACLLVLKQHKPIYPSFETILIYPDTYVVKQKSFDGDIVFSEDSVRHGESWYRGPVVLSWADVVRGSENKADGANVVIHEFAHKLDEENGIMDGLPILREAQHYSDWSEVLNEEYDGFLKRVARRKNTVINEYGSVSAVEFFAVISESFFEKGTKMQAALPDLYAQLQRYYDVDPAAWTH